VARPRPSGPLPVILELAGFEFCTGASASLGARDVRTAWSKGPWLTGLWPVRRSGPGGSPARGGVVPGTYRHGLLESGPLGVALARINCGSNGKPPASAKTSPTTAASAKALLNRLADAFEAHVNLEPCWLCPLRPKRFCHPECPAARFAPVAVTPFPGFRITWPRLAALPSNPAAVTGWQRRRLAGLVIPQPVVLGGSCAGLRNRGQWAVSVRALHQQRRPPGPQPVPWRCLSPAIPYW